MERIRAWAWGLRRTFPTSMFGREKSAPKRARPVTLSTPSGRTGRVPTHLRFLPLLDIRLAPCRRGGGGCMPHPRRGLRVNGGSGRYYDTHGRASNPWAPRREGGRLGGGAGSGPVHPIGGIGGAGELSDIMFGTGLRSPDGVAEFARRAEDLGFDVLGCGEHVMFHVPTANTYISLAVAGRRDHPASGS